MTDPMLPHMRRLNHLWARAMVSMAWTQWNFLSAGLRFANRMMATNWAATPSAKCPSPPPTELAGPKIPGGVEELTRLAEERIAKGLAPPPEIYQLPYRSQIEWPRFPEWAWPTDPEVFEGCCHEG
jgi:hypothetical protein